MSKSRGYHLQAKRQRRINKTLTKHHIRAKSRGGTYDSRNIMVLTWEKHQALHQVFGNRNLQEIFELLLHWCHYRYVLRGESDKEQLVNHYRKEYQHFQDRFNSVS